MKHIDPSPKDLSGSGWRILGELELPIGAEANGIVSAWLTKVLNPINLHMDFLSKLTKSAEDAAIRAIMSERAQTEFEHIHLIIFAPVDRTSRGETWGFFRIEKVGSSSRRGKSFDHSIELYLYLEE